MTTVNKENIEFALLGSSRGLGREFYQILLNQKYSDRQIFQASRKLNAYDFSIKSRWEEYVQNIVNLNPKCIIYFAAGGPYGKYSQFEWKDHEWSHNVTFAFPAYLLHALLRQKPQNLQQVVIIGSSIAESAPDPQASMYCASKHALRGLVTTLQSEGTSFKIKLFSPGYMSTNLLPPNSKPRQMGLAQDPRVVAEELFAYLAAEF